MVRVTRPLGQRLAATAAHLALGGPPDAGGSTAYSRPQRRLPRSRGAAGVSHGQQSRAVTPASTAKSSPIYADAPADFPGRVSRLPTLPYPPLRIPPWVWGLPTGDFPGTKGSNRYRPLPPPSLRVDHRVVRPADRHEVGGVAWRAAVLELDDVVDAVGEQAALETGRRTVVVDRHTPGSPLPRRRRGRRLGRGQPLLQMRDGRPVARPVLRMPGRETPRQPVLIDMPKVPPGELVDRLAAAPTGHHACPHLRNPTPALLTVALTVNVLPVPVVLVIHRKPASGLRCQRGEKSVRGRFRAGSLYRKRPPPRGSRRFIWPPWCGVGRWPRVRADRPAPVPYSSAPQSRAEEEVS